MAIAGSTRKEVNIPNPQVLECIREFESDSGCIVGFLITENMPREAKIAHATKYYVSCEGLSCEDARKKAICDINLMENLMRKTRKEQGWTRSATIQKAGGNSWQ